MVVPPKLYKEEMGPIYKMKHLLRAYGGQKLDLRGIIKGALITNKKGLSVKTDVFIVDGYLNEHLLSKNVCLALEFIEFNRERRAPTEDEYLDKEVRSFCDQIKYLGGRVGTGKMMNVQDITVDYPEFQEVWQGSHHMLQHHEKLSAMLKQMVDHGKIEKVELEKHLNAWLSNPRIT